MKKERTLILFKPETIQRHLIGEFMQRFERRGLKLVACKLVLATSKLVGEHYAETNDWEGTGNKTLKGYEQTGVDVSLTPSAGKTPLEIGLWIRQKLINALQGRVLLALIWQGAHAVALGRKIVGATNPLQADVGSIRGDYSVDSYLLGDTLERPVQNLVHASSSVDEAEREIKVWFKENEIIDYPLVCDEIFYGDHWGRVG